VPVVDAGVLVLDVTDNKVDRVIDDVRLNRTFDTIEALSSATLTLRRSLYLD
jgi:hypothetical protein